LEADLWVIGITDGTSQFIEFIESDSELNQADRLDNVKLQDRILTDESVLARSYSDDTAAELLGEYLRDFYAANPNYAGGSFVQLRLNPDSDLGSGSQGWDIASANIQTYTGDTFNFKLTALSLGVSRSVVHEPATAAFAAGAFLAIGSRRRRRRCGYNQ
jgi:MYXO-CTERM domain-containing protein